MNTKHFTAIMIVALFFTACSSRNAIGSFEDLYTDVKVVKPTAGNYSKSATENNAPIIKDQTTTEKTAPEHHSVHAHLTGHIIDRSFDPEVKLYVYTFLSRDDAQQTVFYYDQKLQFASTVLLDVDILDNYLMTVKKHLEKHNMSIPEKKKIIKHKKRNYKIHEAIEEKISTF